VTISGGCLCGAVRYTIEAEAPIASRLCWCRVCQYLAAGNASVNLLFASAAVKMTGATNDHVLVADSGSVMHRRFCPACGTPITSAAESRPHVVVIRAGTLDDSEIGRPQSLIWAAAAPAWACLDPALPAIDGQPAPPPQPAST
jgi:hypothetical protein